MDGTFGPGRTEWNTQPSDVGLETHHLHLRTSTCTPTLPSANQESLRHVFKGITCIFSLTLNNGFKLTELIQGRATESSTSDECREKTEGLQCPRSHDPYQDFQEGWSGVDLRPWLIGSVPCTDKPPPLGLPCTLVITHPHQA